jgi:hypothetical protein
MDVMSVFTSPLARTGDSRQFIRLVLAQAAAYGMPTQIVALIDDCAAILGLYDPLPETVRTQMAGPFATWRSHANQPSIDHIEDVERLARKQRVLIAFNGFEPDHMVGPAEIVVAMSNMHKDRMPPAYWEVFTWASAHTWAALKYAGSRSEARRKICDERKWPWIEDAEVLLPGGRLNQTYSEMVTTMRRTSIKGIESRDPVSRELLRPIAAHFLLSQRFALQLTEGETEGATNAMIPRYRELVEQQVATLTEMFPGIEKEVEKLRNSEVYQGAFEDIRTEAAKEAREAERPPAPPG